MTTKTVYLTSDLARRLDAWHKTGLNTRTAKVHYVLGEFLDSTESGLLETESQPKATGRTR